jgi:Ubiquinol cytochrome reductase transmembrane region
MRFFASLSKALLNLHESLVGAIRAMAGTKGMGSADGAFDKDRIPKKAGDPTRREFTYFMLGGARFIYASSARLALIKVKMTILSFPRQPRV